MFTKTEEPSLCLQPIHWGYQDLEIFGKDKNGDTLYVTEAPIPEDNHWMGYFIEMTFPGDTEHKSGLIKNEFRVTTPGFVWPNTLPFEDCVGDECQEILL